MAFKKAERSQTKLRMAITGPAGAGKTLSALKIARGLVGPNGKIAVIDTENGSASYYADEFNFDTEQLNPPYLVQKYIDALAQATTFDCVIVDSLSHAWAGEGGILQQKELMDQRAGSNSFTNWGKMTPHHNKLVNAVLHSKTNIICTMRSKTEYVLSDNEKGKKAPQKVGLAPVQRDGFEYEFDVVLDVELESHRALASKDRTNIFAGHDPFKITEEHGKMIAKWQSSGKALEVAAPEAPKDSTTSIQPNGDAQKQSPLPNGTASKPTPNTSTPSNAPATTKTTSTNQSVAVPKQTTKPPGSNTDIPATMTEEQRQQRNMDNWSINGGKITEAQIKRLFAIAREHGWANDDIKAFLSMEFGVESTKEIRKDDYNKICDYLQKNSFNGACAVDGRPA